MPTVPDGLVDRNRELGRVLQDARRAKNVSVTRCAQLVGTSRRRYLAMERGEAIIGVAEFEVLLAFLEIPAQQIWGMQPDEGAMHHVRVRATPGETIQIVVDVRPGGV